MLIEDVGLYYILSEIVRAKYENVGLTIDTMKLLKD
jgi:hypothetical protein